jgi:hypothetical protein
VRERERERVCVCVCVFVNEKRSPLFFVLSFSLVQSTTEPIVPKPLDFVITPESLENIKKVGRLVPFDGNKVIVTDCPAILPSRAH